MAHLDGNVSQSRRLRRAAAAILVAALGTALSVERSAAQVDGLFSGVESAVARGLPAGGPGNTPVRSRLVRVAGQRLAAARDVAAVAGAVEPSDALTLTLNLFADTVLIGIVERTNPTASGTGYVLAGPLDGIGSGTMTLLVYEEGMLGMVRTPTATYSIRPLGEGVHAVSQIDTSGLPPESEPLLPASPPEDPGSGRPAAGPPLPPADDGSVIDVAVFYTGSAEELTPLLTGVTGITGLVDQMVEDTNSAYQASGVIQRIRRVRLQRVRNYNEFGSVASRDALEALRGKNDNVMDEVHGVRDRYGADLVHLIASLGSTCGRAYRMQTARSGFASDAFGVTDYACLASFSFAHELGHNMGLSHDRYGQKCWDSATQASQPCANLTLDNLPHAYSYGYVNRPGLNRGAATSRRWRTIMAYNAACSDSGRYCERVRYFSNPDRSSRDGDPRGIAGQTASQSVTGPSNAARTLNATRTVVANFRQSRISGPDLIVESPQVSEATLGPGQTFLMSVVVRNTGGPMGEFNLPILRYYRSVDPTISRSDTPVRNPQAVPSLAAGASSSESLLLTAPAVEGIYYFGACVTAAAESNTDNNCSSSRRITVTDANLDRAVLVELYNATNGSNWYRKANWLSNDSISTWYGVETDGAGRVTYLWLNDNQLSGPIPSSLGNLASLVQLFSPFKVHVTRTSEAPPQTNKHVG